MDVDRFVTILIPLVISPRLWSIRLQRTEDAVPASSILRGCTVFSLLLTRPINLHNGVTICYKTLVGSKYARQGNTMLTSVLSRTSRWCVAVRKSRGCRFEVQFFNLKHLQQIQRLAAVTMQLIKFIALFMAAGTQILTYRSHQYKDLGRRLDLEC